MANLGEHLHLILKDFLTVDEINNILLKNIDLLPTNIELGLRGLLTDPILKRITRGLFDSLIKKNDKSLPEKMLMYETVTSKTMLRLIRDLKDEFNGEEIKKKITTSLMTYTSAKRFYLPLAIYREIYNYIGLGLYPKRTNTSIIFETSKNSERSEFIEDLRLANYKKIIDNFTDLKIHKKVSASPTIVFSGVLKEESALNLNATRQLALLKQPRLFFKVERADVFTGFLMFEQRIYQQLFKLVQYNMTPHILCKVATNSVIPEFYDTCKTIDEPFRLAMEQEMKKTNAFLIDRGVDIQDVHWNITRLVVTQQGETELYDLLIKEVSLERLKKILFQLFYTLYVFEKIQCCHGDLHLANIFVNKLPTVINTTYKVNNRVYRISTDDSVKVFDFDCGKIFKSTEVAINRKKIPTIEAVENIRRQPGITNVFNKNIDKAKIVLGLLGTEIIEPLVQQIIPGLNKEDETIRETYLRLLFRDDKQEINREEASRIFGVEIKEESDIDKCEIDKLFLDRSWKKYFSLIRIKHMQNWIVKSGTLDNPSTDHLWIPDEVLLPYEQILLLLADPVEQPINVTAGPVYTLDDRL